MRLDEIKNRLSQQLPMLTQRFEVEML